MHTLLLGLADANDLAQQQGTLNPWFIGILMLAVIVLIALAMN